MRSQPMTPEERESSGPAERAEKGRSPREIEIGDPDQPMSAEEGAAYMAALFKCRHVAGSRKCNCGDCELCR